MSTFVSKKLAFIKELFDKGEYEEGIQQINEIEQNQDPIPEETLIIQRFKGLIYHGLGQHELALKIIEELYRKSQEMNIPFFSLDALYIKGLILVSILLNEEFYINLEQHAKLIKLIPPEDTIEFQQREAEFLFSKGAGNFYNGNLDLSLDEFKQSLTLLEKIDPHSYTIAGILVYMVYIYGVKGELQISLDLAEKVLSLIPKVEYYLPMRMKADTYRLMGGMHHQKGDLNRALEYHISSLEIYLKIREGWWRGFAYLNIIDVLLNQNDIKQAQNYLEQFKQFYNKFRGDFNYLLYQLAEAICLRWSSRLRDHVEAESILKKIIGEDSSVFLTNIALINLCYWYFEEFRISNQLEILEDIHPLIDHLQKNAKLENSYILLAQVKLLKAKLAIIQVNMVEARKLLIEAQNIADVSGFQRLAGEISKEHDRLLEELKLWESIKKTQVSVSERLKLASIEGTLKQLQGRRAIEPLESSGQRPISLIILAEGGVLLFSYPFTDRWKQDNDLFGSFLSAFSTFSDEFFSQGLDRAKFGDDTLLLQSAGSFSICYLFQGQTYFAKQKLERFAESLQKTPTIWITLEKFEKSSQVAELRDIPLMEPLLKDVFLAVKP